MLGLLGATRNQTRLVPRPPPSVIKQVEGLIFWDDFNKSNQPLDGTTPLVGGGNWEHATSLWPSNEPYIVSNEATASANSEAFLSASATQTDYIAQMGRNYSALGWNWRTNYQDDPTVNVNQIRIEISSAIPRLNVRRNGATTIQINGTSIGGVPETLHRLVVQDLGAPSISASHLVIVNPTGGRAAMDLDFTSPSQVLNGSGNGPDPRVGGRMFWGDGSKADNVFICGRNISVVGLDTGYKMRLMGGAAVTRSVVVESGGTASLNVDSLALPMDRLEVLDGSDIIVASFDSASYIWGGDEFKFGA